MLRARERNQLSVSAKRGACGAGVVDEDPGDDGVAEADAVEVAEVAPPVREGLRAGTLLGWEVIIFSCDCSHLWLVHRLLFIPQSPNMILGFLFANSSQNKTQSFVRLRNIKA